MRFASAAEAAGLPPHVLARVLGKEARRPKAALAAPAPVDVPAAFRDRPAPPVAQQPRLALDLEPARERVQAALALIAARRARPDNR